MVENKIKQSQYYKKRIQYLYHIELDHIIDMAKKKRSRSIKYNIVFFILLYFSNKSRYSYALNLLPEYYPDEIFKFEFSFMICLLVYSIMQKYLFLRGIKTCYYKRSYYSKWRLIYIIHILKFDIVFRQGIVVFFTLVNLILGDLDFAFIRDKFLQIFDLKYFVPVLLAFVFYQYLMFYKEKYISIKEYNMGIVAGLRTGKNLQKAHYSLIRHIDKSYGLTSVNNHIVDVKVKKNKYISKLDPNLNKELKELWEKFDL